MARVATFATAIVLAWSAGCGGDGDEESALPGSDPVAVSKEFVSLVAAGDPRACELMTANAEDQAEKTTLKPTCEEAIEAREEYLRISFFRNPADGLAAEVDAGELETTETGAEFRFCTPNETLSTIRLIEEGAVWRVDLVSASLTTRTKSGFPRGFPLGGGEKASPCRLKPATG